MKQKYNPTKKITAYGWSSHWSDGAIGWHVSEYLHPKDKEKFPSRPSDATRLYKRTKFVKCRVTIAPVKNKLGRPIVRYFGPTVKK